MLGYFLVKKHTRIMIHDPVQVITSIEIVKKFLRKEETFFV
ncbi:hypothetical protein EMIT040CA3_110040 [Bacillus pseudomycoides]